MPVSAGQAALQVVPTLAKTFSRDLITQMAGPATRAGDQTGRVASQQFSRGFGRDMGRSGDSSARQFNTRFSKRLGAGMSASVGIAKVGAAAIGAGLVGAG